MAATLTLCPPPAQAQHDWGVEAAWVFHKRLFVSYQGASLTGLGVARKKMGEFAPPGGVEKVDGKGAKVLGAGVSVLFSENRGFFQFAYDRAAATFSTWLDPDRTIAFHSIDFTIGYVVQGPVAFVPYFTFGPGWYRQSSYNDPGDAWHHPDQALLSSYEALAGSDYTISAALGAKLGFLRYFAITAEIRHYWEDTGGGCGPNCYYVDAPNPTDYAWRKSVGLQVQFGRLGSFDP